MSKKSSSAGSRQPSDKPFVHLDPRKMAPGEMLKAMRAVQEEADRQHAEKAREGKK